jgi:hypothetical protein
VGVVVYHWAMPNFVWGAAAVAGWILLAAVLGIWPDWRLFVAFVVLMAAWLRRGSTTTSSGRPGR